MANPWVSGGCLEGKWLWPLRQRINKVVRRLGEIAGKHVMGWGYGDNKFTLSILHLRISSGQFHMLRLKPSALKRGLTWSGLRVLSKKMLLKPCEQMYNA